MESSSRERRSPSIRRRRGSPSHLDRRRITRYLHVFLVLTCEKNFCHNEKQNSYGMYSQCSKATHSIPPSEYVSINRQRSVGAKPHPTLSSRSTSPQSEGQIATCLVWSACIPYDDSNRKPLLLLQLLCTIGVFSKFLRSSLYEI